MTVADRYRSLSNRFADLVAAVPPDRWGAQSPCDDWTALGVVRHVVEVHGMFENLAGRPIELPADDVEPLTAFRQVQTTVQGDLDDPDRSVTEWDGFFGRTNFTEGIDRFVCFDLVIHGWDLAIAVGLPDHISDGELARIEGDIEFFGDALHGSGVVGDAVTVPADAERQTRVLAALGRRRSGEKIG